MIVYLTHDTTDFARELRARFLAEGHSVYTGDALAALPAIDLFLATQDERLAGDDFTVLDGVDPEIVMRAVEENLCAPILALEAALPALDRGTGKRVCFVTSGEAASVNWSRQTRGYGYAMSKAALSQAARICYNRLYPEGYTFRLFDPLVGRVSPRQAADAAYEILKNETLPDGRPLKIVRMPFPEHLIFRGSQDNPTVMGWKQFFDENGGVAFDGTPWPEGDYCFVNSCSYCNFLVCNDVVLGQRYWHEGMDPKIKEKDERAKAVLKSVFPGREVVMLDTYYLNLFGGGVHCWTKNVAMPQ